MANELTCVDGSNWTRRRGEDSPSMQFYLLSPVIGISGTLMVFGGNVVIGWGRHHVVPAAAFSSIYQGAARCLWTLVRSMSSLSHKNKKVLAVSFYTLNEFWRFTKMCRLLETVGIRLVLGCEWNDVDGWVAPFRPLDTGHAAPFPDKVRSPMLSGEMLFLCLFWRYPWEEGHDPQLWAATTTTTATRNAQTNRCEGVGLGPADKNKLLSFFFLFSIFLPLWIIWKQKENTHTHTLGWLTLDRE